MYSDYINNAVLKSKFSTMKLVGGNTCKCYCPSTICMYAQIQKCFVILLE